eukprot:GILK01010599.1.p1 GENE.GILK01010599.1~~GILK01010599.1.p1  ORF type:complete len:221 (+),score=20.13 GILK01010599.1:66-665(+)
MDAKARAEARRRKILEGGANRMAYVTRGTPELIKPSDSADLPVQPSSSGSLSIPPSTGFAPQTASATTDMVESEDPVVPPPTAKVFKSMAQKRSKKVPWRDLSFILLGLVVGLFENRFGPPVVWFIILEISFYFFFSNSTQPQVEGTAAVGADSLSLLHWMSNVEDAFQAVLVMQRVLLDFSLAMFVFVFVFKCKSFIH